MNSMACKLCFVFIFISVTISCVKAENRIIGGKEVDIEDYPYQLQLYLDGNFVCGAVLISNNIALSAGHCIPKKGNYEVKGGTTSYKGGTWQHVKLVIMHPSYNKQTSDYDIAILKLNSPFKLSKKIQPIKLPNLNAKLNPGTKGTATGWGFDNPKAMQTSKHLHAVELPVVDQKECSNDYGSFNRITPRMFCAGYKNGGKDACQGDSGGPFAINGVLYGIISWGLSCAEPGHPGVFTSIPELRTYIKLNTKL